MLKQSLRLVASPSRGFCFHFVLLRLAPIKPVGMQSSQLLASGLLAKQARCNENLKAIMQ